MEKEYKESTKEILRKAQEMVERRRALGWTQADFARGLRNMLESPTGDDGVIGDTPPPLRPDEISELDSKSD